MEQEIGKFAFSMSIVQQDDGHLRYDTDWARSGKITRDVVIMKLRALVHWYESQYFDSFDQHAAAVERK
jgi:hypothetical protein